jgi:hypothetical protein
MNGAEIPLLLYYLMSFNPSIAMQPISMLGPMSKADCLYMEKHSDGAWCQRIYVPRFLERK